MDDILLTSEECAEIVHDAQNLCSRCEGTGRLWADGMAHYYDHNRPTRTCPVCGGTALVSGGDAYEAICRAQVRKVYEWLQNETEPRDPSHYWLGARRMLDDKTLCALRDAAGGEE